MRDVIYTSRAHATMSVYVSVRLSVTEVYWRIIADLGFKLRSQFIMHCGRSACGAREGSTPGRVEGSSRAMLATARPSCYIMVLCKGTV